MKLKSLFVEEDVTPAPKTKAAQPVAPTSNPGYNPQYSSSYSPTVNVDPAISDMLTKSLQSSKLAGFDYMKFIASVEKSKASGVSEDARFKMVFSTAQELGVDKDQLVQSGQHYLGVLKENEDDFNSDCSKFEKDEVQGREAKLTQIENSITNLSKQLAQLQQDHETLKNELSEEKTRLESRKASFQATLQTFRATIEQNIQKINQYLQ